MPKHLVFLFGLTGFISFPRLAGGYNHLANSWNKSLSGVNHSKFFEFEISSSGMNECGFMFSHECFYTYYLLRGMNAIQFR